MRLFIAISFPKEIISWITGIQAGLREHTLHGNFTRRENLHLTLHFLGELPNGDVNAIRNAMRRVESRPFILSLGGLGIFQRGSDLWWLGVQKNNDLSDLYNQLGRELASAGFTVDNRPYKPHLTLAREVSMRDKPDIVELSAKFGMMECEINSITLMKSERLRGVLTYTPLYKKTFDLKS